MVSRQCRQESRETKFPYQAKCHSFCANPQKVSALLVLLFLALFFLRCKYAVTSGELMVDDRYTKPCKGAVARLCLTVFWYVELKTLVKVQTRRQRQRRHKLVRSIAPSYVVWFDPIIRKRSDALMHSNKPRLCLYGHKIDRTLFEFLEEPKR
jgi:hypothetical protein